MKYFIVSDIHGFYDELLEALEKVDYDALNRNHKLIVCGDMFDRGPKSFEVYEYLKELHNNDKVIILQGNHEVFLIDYLSEQVRVAFNIERNGFFETVSSFGKEINIKMDQSNIDSVLKYKEDINNAFPDLKEWLSNLPLYYETKMHIFVHAGLDKLSTDETWKDSNKRTMHWESKFYDDKEFDTSSISKLIVAGHTRTHKMPSEGRVGEHGIYKSSNKVMIDGCVEKSRIINVYIFEE